MDSRSPLSTRASSISSSSNTIFLFKESFPLLGTDARREKYDVTCCTLSQSLEEINFTPSGPRSDFQFETTTAGSLLFPVSSPSRNSLRRYSLTCSENRPVLLFYLQGPTRPSGGVLGSILQGSFWMEYTKGVCWCMA